MDLPLRYARMSRRQKQSFAFEAVVELLEASRKEVRCYQWSGSACAPEWAVRVEYHCCASADGGSIASCMWRVACGMWYRF